MHPLMNNMGRHLRLRSIYPVLCFSDIMVITGYRCPGAESLVDESVVLHE